MKNIPRLVFGVLSSLLLAVGFAQAADHFVPVTQNTSHTVNGTVQEDSGGEDPPQFPTGPNTGNAN